MEMRSFADACYADEAPPCTASCPIGYDVFRFVEKMRRGDFNAAYRILAEQLIFPEIVCRICDAPCESSCLRTDIDGPIPLKLLERAACDYAADTAPKRYNAPKKNLSAAVLGASLGGLSAALKLRTLGYDVAVYDAASSYGIDIAGMLPEKEYLPFLATKLEPFRLDFRFGLAGPGDDAAAPEDGYAITLNAAIFGTDPIAAIRLGGEAAVEADLSRQVGNTGGTVPSTLCSLSHIETIRAGLISVPVADRANPDRVTLSADEAISEASLCLECRCDFCKRGCDLMQYYGKLPQEITRNASVTFNSVEGLSRRIATRMINSCYDCGRCAEICGADIDIGGFMIEARALMEREGFMPPPFHDFWLRDMEHAMGDTAFLSRKMPDARFAFFPGCRLGASDPETVTATYRHLQSRSGNVSALIACCGAPAVWAGRTDLAEAVKQTLRREWEALGHPTLVCACMTCIKMLAKLLPEIETVSLYAMLAGTKLPEHSHTATLPFTEALVFDPCSALPDTPLAEEARLAVRTLLSASGVTPATDEPDHCRKACCGFGGQIYPANPDVYDRVAEDRTTASPLPYVTYCSNCNDIFRKQGKESVHILNLIFGDSGARQNAPPTVTEIRRGRERLKVLLLREFADEHDMDSPVKPANDSGGTLGNDSEGTLTAVSILIVEDGLREKMDRALILEDDLLAVIAYARAEDCELLDEETGVLTAHRRIGAVTYWVQYKDEDGAIRLINAYSHRLAIVSEDGDPGAGGAKSS
jgi:Fe-S oxidoreductase